MAGNRAGFSRWRHARAIGTMPGDEGRGLCGSGPPIDRVLPRGSSCCAAQRGCRGPPRSPYGPTHWGSPKAARRPPPLGGVGDAVAVDLALASRMATARPLALLARRRQPDPPRGPLGARRRWCPPHRRDETPSVRAPDRPFRGFRSLCRRLGLGASLVLGGPCWTLGGPISPGAGVPLRASSALRLAIPTRRSLPGCRSLLPAQAHDMALAEHLPGRDRTALHERKLRAPSPSRPRETSRHARGAAHLRGFRGDRRGGRASPLATGSRGVLSPSLPSWTRPRPAPVGARRHGGGTAANHLLDRRVDISQRLVSGLRDVALPQSVLRDLSPALFLPRC